jgi:hypothetical protein
MSNALDEERRGGEYIEERKNREKERGYDH